MKKVDSVTLASENIEVGCIRNLALDLWRGYAQWNDRSMQKSESKREGVKKVRDLISAVAPRWRLVELKRLETFFDQRKASMGDTKSFIYLEPIEKDGWIFPILSISFDYTAYLPSVRLRLALFLTSKDENGNAVPVAIGYRFETPESEGEGVHNYYHAQMIYRFNKEERIEELPECPKWIPEKQPAFALDAAGPYGLFVCMLASLYGRQHVLKIIAREHGPIIRPFVETIALLKSPNAPVFIKPEDNDDVSGLTSVEVSVMNNDIGSSVARVDLFIINDSDKKYWNGSQWSEVEAPLPMRQSNSRFEVAVSLPTLMSGIYVLRAVVHDKHHRINSSSITISH